MLSVYPIKPFDLGAYFLLALGTMFEGPIVTLTGGFAASTNVLNPFGVFLAAALGNLVGDTSWYLVGYFGKINWLVRHMPLFHIKEDQINRIEQDIYTHAPKLLFISKLTMGFSIPTLLAAGAVHVPLRRWYWAQGCAEVLWTGTLTALGFYFGKYLQVVQNGVQTLVLFVSCIFLIILFFYLRKFLLNSNRKE